MNVGKNNICLYSRSLTQIPRDKSFVLESGPQVIPVRRLTPKVLDAKASAPRSRITPTRKGCLDETLVSRSELCLGSL